MCGIAGYIGREEINKSLIESTLQLMKNRGPDFCSYKSSKDGDIHTVLLHSRLSIIDLDARSNQPFTIGNYTLVFNGEIYNYIELRGHLEKKGVRFQTSSDTEVLLQYYLIYGDAGIKDFEGMWSFAIYDQEKSSLILSRDRFAEKPLYYLKTPDGIYFGSEVKFIRCLAGVKLKPNISHLFRYMVNGYKSLYKQEDTFFEEIHEVPFATNLYINKDLSIKNRRYWMPAYSPREMSLKEAIQGFRDLLLNSIKIRLRADVPLAFCLSGGVDSAAIVSIAAKVFKYEVATFSIIESDERYNELENVEATLGDIKCENMMINIPSEGFFERLTELINYHDAPIYTISYYIHSFLSEAVSRKGYRVVCSGTGADELVTGYYDHFSMYLYEMRDRQEYKKYLKDWEENTGKVVRNPFLKKPELFFDNPGFRDHIYLNNDVFGSIIKDGFREEFTENQYADDLLHNRMMNELLHESIPVILHEDDLNSMMYSIENRSPYLDSRLFDFSYSIPTEFLIRDGYGKYILREALSGILNDKVRMDRQKKGFNASIHSVVDFSLKDNREFLLDNSPVYDYVKRENIENIISMKPMLNSYSKFLFSFINAKIFLEQN